MAADLERRGDAAGGDRQHRPHAQHLLDDGVEVGLVAVADPRLRLRVAREPLERPRERAGRRLVAGREHGHDLVAQLLAGDPGLARARASSEPSACPPRSISRASSASTSRHGRQERVPGRAAVQRHRDQPRQRRRHVERAADRGAQLRPLDRAEHDAQDHVERERLHPRQRAQLAGRPARDLGARHRRDGLAPAGERLAVEGGQQLAPPAQVLGAVREQDRRRAGERLQHGRAGAAVQHAVVGGEDPPDLGRVGDQHHRRVRPRHADGERVAVARAAAAQERGRPRDPLDRLQRGRLAGSGRQRHAAHCRPPVYSGWRPPKPDSGACQCPTSGSSSSQQR